MKLSWIKYIVVSAIATALSVVWYQQFRQPEYSPKEAKYQDSAIKSFDTSELNRAKRIAQKEQEFYDIDVDVPVTFEEYDQAVGHVPEEKLNKVAIQPYDPNAGLSIDRSGSSAFGQFPIDSEPFYEEQPSFAQPNFFMPFSNDNRSRSSNQTDTPSKVSKKAVEESPILSKIEYPKEIKDISDKTKYNNQKFYQP